MTGVVLAGLGGHRPARSAGNDEVALRCGADADWIRERTGITARGVAGDAETVVAMGSAAAAKALAAAGVLAADLDLVLLATCSMPSAVPGGAPAIAHDIGATAAGAADVGAGCAGFCYALALGADAVRAGSARHVLVVGSERMTDLVDPGDRTTAPLFGDGAGAAVLSGSGSRATDGVGRAVWAHDGGLAPLLATAGAPPRLRMEGRAVYRWATTVLPDLARRACAAAGVEPSELAAFVPHQANLRITEAVVRALALPSTVAVARDVVDAGNTSAASVPLALVRLRELGEVGRGDPVLLLGFGAGMTAAGQVVRCP